MSKLAVALILWICSMVFFTPFVFNHINSWAGILLPIIVTFLTGRYIYINYFKTK